MKLVNKNKKKELTIAPEVIGAFIPIIFIIVTGLIIVSVVHLRSKEKQMLIEKGFSADQIREFFQRTGKRKNRFLCYNANWNCCVFFGLGIGLGLMFEDMTRKNTGMYYLSLPLQDLDL